MKRFASALVACLFLAGLAPATVLATDPPMASDASVTAKEDTGKVITLSAEDPDGTDIQDFDIDAAPSNGILGSISAIDCTPGPACTATVTYVPDPNANGADSFDFTATDGNAETSAAATVSITVDAVNDAPSFTAGSDVEVDEDSGPKTVTEWASGLSAGPTNESGQALSFNVVTDHVTLFSAVPEVDPLSGDLTFTPAANAHGTTDVHVTLQDNGGTSNAGDDTSPTRTFTITIDSVNDKPTANDDSVTINEDSGKKNIDVLDNDSDAPDAAESLTVTGIGAASDGIVAIHSGGGSVDYTPDADFSGSDSFTYTISDGDLTDTATVHVTVNPINDEPSFTAGTDQTVLEDSGAHTVPGWATDISAGPGESGQNVTFDVTDDTNAGLFSAGPSVDSDGDLHFTPATDAVGTATITLDVQDDGGTQNGGDDTSDTQSFAITVTGVNDRPTFVLDDAAIGAFEDAGPQTVSEFASSISAGPDDEAGQTVHFTITGNDNTALFSVLPAVNAAGDLTFKAASNKNGIAHITVNLADNGGTANGGEDTSADQAFTIDVSGVDDPPLANIDLFTVHLTGATTLDVRGNDIGGPNEQGDPTHVTSVTTPARGFVTITAGGAGITYDPFGCSTGTDSFTYTLADAGGQTDTATVFITVSSPSAYPAADGPRPAFVTGSTIGSTTPVKLSWCGLTSGTTMKAWKLDQSRNGGGYTTAVASTTATSNTRSLAVSPTSYQFRARITDKKNHTAFGTGPKFKIVRTQDTSTSIAYSSGWSKSSKGSPSGGSSHATTGKSKTATMTFTGRGFAIVGTLGKGHGSFSVYVDGAKVTAISTKSKKTHDRRVLYARTTANGTHTIKVVTSGNGRVDLDAILTFIAG